MGEPIAFAVHFENVDMVGQAVEQGAGQPLGAEHAGPFVERQIAGHDGAPRSYRWLKTSNSSSAPVCDSGT